VQSDVTVCVPAIPSRLTLLQQRALPSVWRQTYPVDAVAVSVDYHRQGAWWNRNATVAMVATRWLAFLDDDDELLPHHLECLTAVAAEHDADVVWGWFEVVGGTDPFPTKRGRPWDPAQPHAFPITALVNAELVREAGAQFAADLRGLGSWEDQDLPFWSALAAAGGRFVATPEITWRWWHHKANTSGLPSRW
jgi:hypothetical protein